MRAKVAALVAGAAALVGVGLWLGQRTSPAAAQLPAQASSPAPAAEAIEPAARSAATRPARAPVLPPRHAAPSADLAADLADPDPKVRRAAVREVDDPQALLAASRDADVEVAMVAMQGLGRRYAEGELPAKEMIARATDRGRSERVRSAALNALGAVPNPEGAATLVELLARGDVLERRAASALLVNQDPALAVPALIAALGDADEYVRIQALDSLRARSRGRDFGTDAAAWTAWWQARRL